MINTALFKEQVESELKNHIIPFWKNLKDDEFGGFYGLLDYKLNLDKTADKGAILNSRILWFFSSSYMKYKDPELLKCAEHAYKFLNESMYDRTYGGIVWSAKYDGSIGDSTKYTYNMAFAIYGLSAYYRASNDKNALNLAYKIYNCIETKCKDEGGYLESFERDFKPIENEQLSENGVLAERTMNTLLHVFEGYSGLYETTHDAQIEAKLREIVNIFLYKVYNPKLHRQEVFFNLNYNSLIDLYSYGHDIETSWLLEWGVSLLDDKKLSAKVSAICEKMCLKVTEMAFHGGSIYCECVNGIDNKKRVWWEEAECVLGFINEYKKHPEDETYLKRAFEVWSFIRDHMVDKREGSEWLNELRDDLTPIVTKNIVDEWKCPYHNSRMCLEILRRL